MVNHQSAVSILNPDRSVDKKVKLQGGDLHGRRLQVVCKACNNHWMSDLQKVAKPTLVPLVTGQPIVLDIGRQKILAAWATMSVICAEYFNPDRAAIAVTDRRWLFNTKTAPNNFRIWIGDYERGDWKGHLGHFTLRISQFPGEERWARQADGTPKSNTQITTFVVGRLFIHAYSCPFPEILHADKVVREVDASLVQIWPPRHSTITWPAARVTDQRADQLVDAIFRQLDEAGATFGA
jgi:hypothetical protein